MANLAVPLALLRFEVLHADFQPFFLPVKTLEDILAHLRYLFTLLEEQRVVFRGRLREANMLHDEMVVVDDEALQRAIQDAEIGGNERRLVCFVGEKRADILHKSQLRADV